MSTQSKIARPKAAKPRLKGKERRAQILKTATRVFSESGYSDTKMEDIAAACGITKPILYSHFPSKQDLFEVVLRRSGKELLDLLLSVMAATDKETQLIDSLHALMVYVHEHRGLNLNTSLVGSGRDSRLAAMMEEQRNIVVDAAINIMTGLKPPEMSEKEAIRKVTPLAHSLIGAADAGAQWWNRDGSFSIAEVKHVSYVVLNGFMDMARKELNKTDVTTHQN